MSFYVIDVESDGQILARNSLVCFGAVRLDNELQTTFYGKTHPSSPFSGREQSFFLHNGLNRNFLQI